MLGDEYWFYCNRDDTALRKSVSEEYIRVRANLLGASFLGVRGMSCGSSVNSYSWTLGCRFLDLGRPGPGPGP